jgi:hypothetical protein
VDFSLATFLLSKGRTSVKQSAPWMRDQTRSSRIICGILIYIVSLFISTLVPLYVTGTYWMRNHHSFQSFRSVLMIGYDQLMMELVGWSWWKDGAWTSGCLMCLATCLVGLICIVPWYKWNRTSQFLLVSVSYALNN